jgi:hypothetical protein
VIGAEHENQENQDSDGFWFFPWEGQSNHEKTLKWLVFLGGPFSANQQKQK